MNELQLITNVLKELPDSVVWVIGFYFILKALLYGSIYGVIALGIKKLHNWAITKKVDPPKPDTVVLERSEIADITITHDGTYEALVGQLKRLSRMGSNQGIGLYVHKSHVHMLSEALDLMDAKMEEAK